MSDRSLDPYIGAHVCIFFGDTSAVGDWRSRRLLVRQQIARLLADCALNRGIARPQAAGVAMEAWGGQRGTSVDIAIVCN